MMGSVTKATPIQFIDSKSRIKKWSGHKTALSAFLSRDLLLMASGADTHTHTNVRGRNDFKKPGTRVWPAHAWFKNIKNIAAIVLNCTIIIMWLCTRGSSYEQIQVPGG